MTAVRDLLLAALRSANASPELIDELRRFIANVAPAAGQREPGLQDHALLGKPEAARALGISIATLDRACRDGAPFVQVRGRRRFDLEALRAWFGSYRPGARAESAADRDSVDIRMAVERAGLRAVGGKGRAA